MRLGGSRRSSNVEDRRGARFPGGGGGLGIGAILLALIGGYVFGINPQTILGIMSGIESPQTSAPGPVGDDPGAVFTSKILAETEDTWRQVFQEAGRTYKEPVLVLYSGLTQTACGMGQAASGPFYCPADQKIYIDLSFFDELRDRFAAPGEFAQAYVIAHEIGHHVQTLLGTSQQVHAARQQARSQAEANALSVRQELQADCYAGVWAQRTDAAKGILEPGEYQQAIAAATAIGDDRLQSQAGRAVVPESFTHGSSEQRVRWFERGFRSGDAALCDTFDTTRL
jgi:predicted metalloprotease